MDHRFTGNPFTVGIEEELMLVDPESLDLAQGIEQILADADEDGVGHIKPELMQSVLEIATEPCAEPRSRRRNSCGRCGSGWRAVPSATGCWWPPPAPIRRRAGRSS